MAPPRKTKTPTPASTATQSETTSYASTSVVSTTATSRTTSTDTDSSSVSRGNHDAKYNKICFIASCTCIILFFIIFWVVIGYYAYEYFSQDYEISDEITQRPHHPTKKTSINATKTFSAKKSRIGSEVDQLRVPEGFAIKVYANLESARFMLALPGDFVLVSQPTKGTIKILNPALNSTAGISDFATGLRQPHDMFLYNDGQGNSYLYVAESNQIARYPFRKGDTRIGKAQVLVANLPDNKTYGYNHYLKNIAVGKDTLYVSIGSTSNADPKDLARDPKAGSIYGYSLTGKNRRLISEGIRSVEGMAFAPGTEDLWVVTNQRDNVKYPYKDDTDNYGQIIADYANKNPPEEFTKVKEGENYGWPYCNPIPSYTMDDLDYVPDVDNNENETAVNCSSFRKVDKGIQAHSAPLGLTFWTGDKVDKKYRGGALVAMHGSWNRWSSIRGNKVSFFPWVNGRPGTEIDLVTGWVNGKERWGRPVDVAVLEDGSVLISDDMYDVVYKLYKVGKNLK